MLLATLQRDESLKDERVLATNQLKYQFQTMEFDSIYGAVKHQSKLEED